MKQKQYLSIGQAEALHATQGETNDPIESPKGVHRESKSSSSGSDAELEPALNKFFGGPPFCLMLPDSIEGHTEPRTGNRACKGRVQSSSRSYAIVSWMDVLSEATTRDHFQLQENGMYWCRVKGRLIEMSAENYHFIALGYPQRMMQPSYLSEARREQETAGGVGEQDVNTVVNPDTESRDNPVPDPMDITRSPTASDLSHRTEKSTTISYQGERDVKGTSHVAQEFQAETSRLRPNHRQTDFQSRRKQGFSGWAPVWVANNPVRSEDDPIKSDIPIHIDNGSAGSSDVPKQSQPETSGAGNRGKLPATPVRRKNVFIPWTPSPKKKKDSHTQEGSAVANTSPRAEAPMRYSSRELSSGPAFIKSLIEAGTPWEEQEELYESKFGISRSQFRLVKQFGLVDMKDGGFDKAAFKKPRSHHKAQLTSTHTENRESSLATEGSQGSDGERDKKIDKGKKRDPGPSDAA